MAELNDKLQNISSLLKETREWLVESQKLHKRCADNAVKVIAELQAQKAQAEDDCAYWKTLAQKRNLTKPPNRAKDNKMNSLDMINAQQCKLSENLEPFPRGNHDEICRLSNERRGVFYDLAKLNKAIEADPEAVSAHHKELWRKQAKAMQEYVDVLGERIKDLIDNG